MAHPYITCTEPDYSVNENSKCNSLRQRRMWQCFGRCASSTYPYMISQFRKAGYWVYHIYEIKKVQKNTKQHKQAR